MGCGSSKGSAVVSPDSRPQNLPDTGDTTDTQTRNNQQRNTSTSQERLPHRTTEQEKNLRNNLPDSTVSLERGRDEYGNSGDGRVKSADQISIAGSQDSGIETSNERPAKGGSHSELPDLDVLRTVPKAVAFDVPLANTSEGSIIRRHPPRRLQVFVDEFTEFFTPSRSPLQRLETVPRLTPAMLEEKLKSAEERKEMELQKKTKSAARTSRRHRQIKEAMEFEKSLKEEEGTRSVACQDSNPGPLDSESHTLPLRHTTPHSQFSVLFYINASFAVLLGVGVIFVSDVSKYAAARDDLLPREFCWSGKPSLRAQKLPRQQIVPRGRILLASLTKITPTPNKSAKEASSSAIDRTLSSAERKRCQKQAEIVAKQRLREERAKRAREKAQRLSSMEDSDLNYEMENDENFNADDEDSWGDPADPDLLQPPPTGTTIRTSGSAVSSESERIYDGRSSPVKRVHPRPGPRSGEGKQYRPGAGRAILGPGSSGTGSIALGLDAPFSGRVTSARTQHQLDELFERKNLPAAGDQVTVEDEADDHDFFS
ncbi:hypothetical protein Bbelb_166210 [Branchiostoma belcheri]|nr:hypothetical protein Bbelb_166210 [Branchiostoma belcheri]